MTIDEYLANYSNKRIYDNALKKWFVYENGAGYISKSKEEWDIVISEFFSTTEKKVKNESVKVEKAKEPKKYKPRKKISEIEGV